MRGEEAKQVFIQEEEAADLVLSDAMMDEDIEGVGIGCMREQRERCSTVVMLLLVLFDSDVRRQHKTKCIRQHHPLPDHRAEPTPPP